MPKKQVIIFVSLIILLASFLRLWQLGIYPPGLYHDEAMNGNNALEALKTDPQAGGFKWFYPENNGREGLFINLQAIFLAIFGNEAWVLRLVSAIFGILTTLGLFFLTKELFKNSRLALFSSFFLAVSFWHIIFSRIGFRAVMAPFFLVWSFYLLFKILNSKFKIQNFYAIFAGLLFGLGFHSYIAYRVAPFLLIIPFVKLWRNGQKNIILIFLLATFATGAPLGWYFWENPQDFLGRTSQVSVFSSESPLKNIGENIAKTAGMLFFKGDSNWRHNMAGEPQLFWPVGILLIIGVLICLVQVLKIFNFQISIFNQFSNFKFSIYFLFLWIIVMSLPVIISNEGLPHALRSIILIPPIMIFAGIGLEFIYEKISKRSELNSRLKKEFVVLLFVFLFCLVGFAFIQYFFRWAPDVNTYYAFNGRYADIGKYLNQLPKETEKYVIINSAGVLARGLPMPAQTIMFITETYLEKEQKEKNIFYILPEKIENIKCVNFCTIVTMEIDVSLRERIKNQVSGLVLSVDETGVEFLTKK